MGRHSGPFSKNFRGAKRPDLVSFGKKLLGHLDNMRNLSGVKAQTIQKIMADGSTVRAEFVGDMPRISVFAPGSQSESRKMEIPNPDGFVVTARNEANPDGINPEFPQQILQYRAEDGEWRTYFYSAEDAEESPVSGDKSTYKRTFPSGLHNAGNLDWLGALPEGGTDADRVRLTYYGPTRRYWYDGWRKPDAQYGRWVFLNGRVLLDIEAVNTARADASLTQFAEQYVLGAAYRDGWLYVMQAAIPDFGSEAMTIPDQDGFPAASAGWITPLYPDGDASLRLVRYRVSLVVNQAARSFSYKLDQGESVWTRNGRGLVNPWVFNPTGTGCETFAMPDELRATRFQANTIGDLAWDFESLNMPSESSEHISLSISEAGVVDQTVSPLSVEYTIPDYSSGTGLLATTTAVIAADYAPDGSRVELVITNRAYSNPPGEDYEHGRNYITLRIDSGTEVTLHDDSREAGIGRVETMALVLADLRHGWLVLYGCDSAIGNGPTGVSNAAKVYQFGSLQQQIDSGYTSVAINGINSAYTDVIDRTLGPRTFMVSPLFLLSGALLSSRYYYTGGTVTPDILQTLIWLRPGGQFPVSSPAQERAGRVRYNFDSNNFLVRTFSMATPDTPLSWSPSDNRGYRTPASIAFDGTRLLVSFNTLAFSIHLTLEQVGWSAAQLGGGAFWRNPLITGGDPAEFITIHCSSDSSLPDLTGVDGDGARYAPIWQFGAFPTK